MGELHYLSVGCADCTVLKSAASTFLIDCRGIGKHAALLPADKKLKAVFITHQHYDHFDGLGYLKENGYTIDYLIYSPYERLPNDGSVLYQEWQDFLAYRDYFVSQGTQPRAPYRQESFDNPYLEVDDLKFFILGPAPEIAKTDTRHLHDACLVIRAHLGSRKCLFAGDASDRNLKFIADNTADLCGDILHASHHGSIHGAELSFVQACQAKYTVVSTSSGVYDDIPDPTALQRYREHTSECVYRTDTDGSLQWTW